ncbi:hypothetical protein QAD02_017707, partial [Eretmocerus hayati]
VHRCSSGISPRKMSLARPDLALLPLLLLLLLLPATLKSVVQGSVMTTTSGGSTWMLDSSRRQVQLAVIAPGDPQHEQSLPRLLPAVFMAVKAVSSPRGPLPGWNIRVDYRDSQCSSTFGPLAAFDFYINRTA